MAVKVTIKVGPGTGPLIVLKHPELQWKLHCVNQGQGKVFLVLGCHEPGLFPLDQMREVSDGFLLPRDTRMLSLLSENIPDAFCAHLIGVPEDAVSAH